MAKQKTIIFVLRKNHLEDKNSVTFFESQNKNKRKVSQGYSTEPILKPPELTESNC